MQTIEKKVLGLVGLTAVLVVVVLLVSKNRKPENSNNYSNNQNNFELNDLNPNQALANIPAFLLNEKQLKPVSAYEYINKLGDRQVVIKLEAIAKSNAELILKFYESGIKNQKDWAYINTTKVQELNVIVAEKQDRSQGLKVTLFSEEKEKPLEVELLLTFPKNIPQIKK
jgi:hypothetical protein